MQLRKESLKNQACRDSNPDLCNTGAALTGSCSNMWISYIYNFIFIFPRYITNQFNNQLPVGLLAQLVRALHRYRRGQGPNPGKPSFFFFRLSVRNCISCVNNCEDLLYVYLNRCCRKNDGLTLRSISIPSKGELILLVPSFLGTLW